MKIVARGWEVRRVESKVVGNGVKIREKGVGSRKWVSKEERKMDRTKGGEDNGGEG